MRLRRRKRVYVDDLPRTHDVRFLALFVVMFVAVLGGVYAVGYVAAGDKVPARTTVAGVDVGSMSRAQAKALLNHRVGTRLDQPLTVRSGTHSVTITPAKAGVSFDVTATLDAAMGGDDWDPGHMLKVVEGGGQVSPVFRADRSVLDAALAPLAARVETDPVDSRVVVRGTEPVLVPGHPGLRLDAHRAAAAVSAALRDQATSIRLAPTRIAPQITEAVATGFIDDTLRPMLAKPVVISVGGHRVSVRPFRYAPALTVTTSEGRLRVGVRPGLLYSRSHDLLVTVPGRPVNANVVFEGGSPVVRPGRPGVVVSADAWAHAVLVAATRPDRQAVVQVRRVNPSVTTAEARSWQIHSVLSDTSTTTSARLSGALTQAAQHLSGTRLLPGARFSYRATVGSPYAATVLGPLGSLSQSAAERAGLTVTRWPLISPAGHDLGLRNDTSRPMVFRAWVSPAGPKRAVVHVQVWGSTAP